MKIGALVRNSMGDLIKNDRLTCEMVDWLSDKKYCKETFDINYPMLLKVKNGALLSDQRKINGYDRYRKDVVIIKGVKYFICNDWYDRNQGKFQMWLDNIPQSIPKQKKSFFSFFKIS